MWNDALLIGYVNAHDGTGISQCVDACVHVMFHGGTSA